MKSILVVDDDLELARLLAFALRLRGYMVRVAANGMEALSLIGQWSFDAIVLDWNMPIMNGEDFLKERQLRTPSILLGPIVVITARPDADPKARQLGAAAVVEKPFNLAELLEVLKCLAGDPQ
jgi:DNA-binding response OmpR family regulator